MAFFFENKRIARCLLILSIGMCCMMQTHATPVRPQRDIVVLIHGLMRTSLSMRPIKTYLEHQNYRVFYYDYASARFSLHEHALHLQYYIEELLANNPHATVHFVTHSMGGIIVREAISSLNKSQFQQIGCLVMMAPPNQGSVLAKISTQLFPAVNYFIKPLAELSSDNDAYVHKVPVPQLKIGIIAGRYDAKAPPSSAQLLGQTDLALINSTHTFIMNKSQTKQLIVHFLENGRFNP